MQRAICAHCGEPIGLWSYPRQWMHAPDAGPDAYPYCGQLNGRAHLYGTDGEPVEGLGWIKVLTVLHGTQSSILL